MNDEERQNPVPDSFTAGLFVAALAMIGAGLTAAASWGVASAVLGGILLGVVFVSKLKVRRPVE